MQPVAGKPDDQFVRLLARVRDGDEEAAAELVAQYEGIIRRRARRLISPALRVHVDSADISQSVNRSLLTGLKRAAFSVATPEQLTRLALTLVRRRVARHWRKHKREAGLRSSNEPVDDLAHQTRPRLRNTSELSEAVQLDEMTRRVLDQLEGLDRQLVELRLLGHTTAEAARILGVGPGILRSRLSRLRKRLWEQGLSPNAI